jgi:hypothetical protein
VFTGRGSSGYEHIFSRVLHRNKKCYETPPEELKRLRTDDQTPYFST